MGFRHFLAGLLILATAIIMGCSGAGDESFSSSWTTLPSKAGTAVTTPDTAAEMKITLLPANTTVYNSKSVPISVSLAGSGSADVTLPVAMSSTLGGTFNPESGNFSGGSFITSFTAPTNITGPTELIAISGAIIGTGALQILPNLNEISILPALNPAAKGSFQQISVKVTDSTREPLKDVSVFITSLNGGKFGADTQAIEKSDSAGFAYFTYEAPTGLMISDTLTVQVLGISTSVQVGLQ